MSSKFAQIFPQFYRISQNFGYVDEDNMTLFSEKFWQMFAEIANLRESQPICSHLFLKMITLRREGGLDAGLDH